MEGPAVSMKEDVLNPYYRFLMNNLAHLFPNLVVFPLKNEDVCSSPEGLQMLIDDPLRVKGGGKLKTMSGLVDQINASSFLTSLMKFCP